MAHRTWLGLLTVVALSAGCGGSATPTPATPAPRPALAAGEHNSNAFRPAAKFTLPDGWLIAEDVADYLALQPAASDAVGIYLFRSPRPASQDPSCPTTAISDIGTTAKEVTDWIRSLPGLVVGDPTSVTLGGLVGLQFDVAIAAGWSPSCPFANGIPTVPLFVGAESGSYRWVVAGKERLRLAILDVPGDGTVVVDIDDFDGSLIDSFLPTATPIVTSLRFALT